MSTQQNDATRCAFSFCQLAAERDGYCDAHYTLEEPAISEGSVMADEQTKELTLAEIEEIERVINRMTSGEWGPRATQDGILILRNSASALLSMAKKQATK